MFHYIFLYDFFDNHRFSLFQKKSKWWELAVPVMFCCVFVMNLTQDQQVVLSTPSHVFYTLGASASTAGMISGLFENLSLVESWSGWTEAPAGKRELYSQSFGMLLFPDPLSWKWMCVRCSVFSHTSLTPFANLLPTKASALHRWADRGVFVCVCVRVTDVCVAPLLCCWINIKERFTSHRTELNSTLLYWLNTSQENTFKLFLKIMYKMFIFDDNYKLQSFHLILISYFILFQLYFN